jgi:hypothetical protein
VHDRLSLGKRAAEATREHLGKVSGQSGVSQRALKGTLQRANAAPSGGGATDAAGAVLAEAESKKLQESRGRGLLIQNAQGDTSVTTSVRQVNRKTFYLKRNVWQDSEVTEEDFRQALLIRQFSREFFDLAASLDGQSGKYLVFNEPVVVKLGRQTYRVEPSNE